MSKTKSKGNSNGNTTKGPKPGMAAYFRGVWERNKSLNRDTVVKRFVKRWGKAKKLTVLNYIGYALSGSQYNPLPHVLKSRTNKKGEVILSRGKLCK
jgi:hypothetical protein